jgi:starch phosphorylase
VRNRLRGQLVQFIRQRVAQQVQRRCAPGLDRAAALEMFDEHALTIGFARRFATYKRALLIFRDLPRLARILGDPERPVQFVVAGKAHPADFHGQRVAQQVFRFARQVPFRNHVVVLENYDMHVARMLTAGCDVWLNTPRPPQEASGTSGMKPALHGGLNCSVLDGWWAEAFNGRNGWAIQAGPRKGSSETTPDPRRTVRETARTRAWQDREDAAALYRLLEEEIVPLFYDRGPDGLPRRWVRRMVNSMKTVCGRFNTNRMLGEYVELYLGQTSRARNRR